MNRRRAYLRLKNVPDSKWSYVLNNATMTLGTNPVCQIWVPNLFGRVAGRHAELGVDERGRWLRDLASDAGTAINGVWIDGHKRASLQIGDVVWIGRVEIEVVSHLDEVAQINPADWAVSPAPSNAEPSDRNSRVRGRFGTLTDTELEIVLEFSRGTIRADQLAECFGFEPSTAKVHLRSIYGKLGVHGDAELEFLVVSSTRNSGNRRGAMTGERLHSS
jgi:DNA-binding CsgD family transcriptional regulator